MAAKVKALQEWCRRQCDGYRDVNVTNLTSSWKSGLAFCAIIHRYRPDLIDYDSLKKEDVFENNKLAFDVASEQLGIPALLDPEDMVIMTVPDKLCIVTYVAQYYNYFHDKPQAGGPGVRSGVKRQSVHDRVPVNNTNDIIPPEAKRSVQHAGYVKEDEPIQTAYQENETAARRRGGTMEDRCQMCNNKVYLLERHISSTGRLYHRHCFRGFQRNSSIYKKVPDEKENLIPSSNVSSSGKSDIGQLDSAQSSRIKNGLSDGQSPLTSKKYDKSRDETSNNCSTKPFISGSCLSENENIPSTKPFVISVSGSEITSKPIVSRSLLPEVNTAVSSKPPANNSALETRSILTSKAFVSSTVNPEVKSSFIASPAVSKSYNPEITSGVLNKPIASTSSTESKSIFTAKPTVSSTLNSEVKSPFVASLAVSKSFNPEIRSGVLNQPVASSSSIENKSIFTAKSTVSSTSNSEVKNLFSPAVSKTLNPEIRSGVLTKPVTSSSLMENKSIFTAKPTVSSTANTEVKSTFLAGLNKYSNPEIRNAVLTKTVVNNSALETQSIFTAKTTVSNSANPVVKCTFSASPALTRSLNPETTKPVTKPANSSVVAETKSIFSIKPTVSNTASPDVKSAFLVSRAVSKSPEIRSAVLTTPAAYNSALEIKKSAVSSTANSETKSTFWAAPAISKSSNHDLKGAVITKPVDSRSQTETKSTFSSNVTSYGIPSVEKSTAFQARTTSSSIHLLSTLYSTPGYKTDGLSSVSSSSVTSIANNVKETHLFKQVNAKTAISSSANVSDSARNPQVALSTAVSSLTTTSDTTASKPTVSSVAAPMTKLTLYNNSNAEVTLGGLASSIGLIKLSVVSSTQSSTMNAPNSKVLSITHVSSATSAAFGSSTALRVHSKSAVGLSSTSNVRLKQPATTVTPTLVNYSDKYSIQSVTSSWATSSSTKYDTNVGVLSGEAGALPKYTISSVVSSGVTSTVKPSSAFITPHRISKITESTSSISSNSATSHLTVNNRAESTSVTWSNPWSSRSSPAAENSRIKSLEQIKNESSSDESSKLSKVSLTDEGKSTMGERRTCEKDQEIVSGLLQKLAEVREEKRRNSATIGRNSLSGGLVAAETGLNTASNRAMGSFETIYEATPKSTFAATTVGTVVLTLSSKINMVTTNVACTSASKPRDVVVSTSSKTEWQLEAERRSAERRGVYVDPEKKINHKPETLRSLYLTTTVAKTVVGTDKDYLEPNSTRTTHIASKQPFELSNMPMKKPDHVLKKYDEVSEPSWPHPQVVSPVALDVRDSAINSVAPPTNDETTLIGRRQIVIQHLPPPVPHKITDSSEPTVPVDVILRRLDELDRQLQVMESEGRELEEKIRGGSDDAMDQDKDSVMGKWFDLIKQRNELIREESYYMYKRRQQELEQLHEELEYQLRCLLEKPEGIKSPQDKRHEEELLSELIETVTLRSAIIDSIESDRIRNLEEDKKLEALMASSGLTENKDGFKRRNSKVKKKKHTFAEKQGNQGEKTKSKIKLFKFKTGKKSDPKPDADTQETN